MSDNVTDENFDEIHEAIDTTITSLEDAGSDLGDIHSVCLWRAPIFLSKWVYLKKRLVRWLWIFYPRMRLLLKCLLSKFWKAIAVIAFGFLVYVALNYYSSPGREHERLLKHFESIKMAK